MMGAWVLFRLLRGGLIERWKESQEKKQKPPPPPVVPGKAPMLPTPPPAAVPRQEQTAWKAVDEDLARTRNAAESLESELRKQPETERLAPWIRRAVFEEAEQAARDLKASGGIEGATIRAAVSKNNLLRYRLHVFQRLAKERESGGDRLAKLDDVAEGLFRPLLEEMRGDNLGLCAHGRAIDESMRRTLVEMSIMPIEAPVGWPDNSSKWPEGFHGVLSDVLFGQGNLLSETYQKTGLSTSWPIPYSEPVYVDGNQVLGPFGSWLPGLIGDLASVLLLGPSWAEALAAKLIADTKDIGACNTVPTTGSGWHLASLPATGFRLLLLSRVLDNLNYRESGQKIRKWLNDSFGDCEVLYMPTRRGSYYGVGIGPYLEAGQGLVAFILEQQWDEFGGRKLQELPFFKRHEVSPEIIEALIPSAVAGRPMTGPMRQRIATGLGAFVRTPESRERIVRSVLYGLGPKDESVHHMPYKHLYAGDMRGMGPIESLGGLSMEPQVIMESILLHEILEQPAYLPRIK